MGAAGEWGVGVASEQWVQHATEASAAEDAHTIEDAPAEEEPPARGARSQSRNTSHSVEDESALVQGLIDKRDRGEALSNKERRRLVKFEQSQAVISSVQVVTAPGQGVIDSGWQMIADAEAVSTLEHFSLVIPSGAVEAAALSGARDIVVPEFGISAPGKELFASAQLKLAEGKRYGLVSESNV